MRQSSYDNTPTLYIVPTPIGNLEDMTYRAVNILKLVDKIGCEDTRTSGVLLKHYEITTPTFAAHDHNQSKVKESIIGYLNNGMNIAIISDAGMPGISDPGYEIVRYVVAKGFNVVTLPGANAAITALVSSGIVPQPFTFYGFLNQKEGKRKKELENLKYKEETIIFYESPHRISSTVETLLEVFGNREITLARELSKKFEEYIRCNLETLVNNLNGVKGEIVLVVEGYRKEQVSIDEVDIKSEVETLIENGLSTKDAIKEIADKFSLKKREVYNEYHNK